MKALKIIPMFLGLIVMTYVGMLFVEANREEVVISFGNFHSPPTPQGFVVFTSILIGMLVAGFLCSIEMLALYVQNKRLRRQIARPEGKKKAPTVEPTDIIRSSTRLT